MPVFETATRFDAPAADVWAFVSWTGVGQLAEGGFFTAVEFEEERPIPGAVRLTHLPDGPPIKERLEEIREADMLYRYSLTDTGPLPITDYLGMVRVTPAGPSACTLKLAHEGLPVGVTEDAWRAQWLEIENAVFAFIRSRVEA